MKSTKVIIAALLTVFANGALMAQVPPPASGGNPSCWPPPCVPVDNGVVFLIAAGALYGAKKIYDVRKKTVSQS